MKSPYSYRLFKKSTKVNSGHHAAKFLLLYTSDKHLHNVILILTINCVHVHLLQCIQTTDRVTVRPWVRINFTRITNNRTDINYSDEARCNRRLFHILYVRQQSMVCRLQVLSNRQRRHTTLNGTSLAFHFTASI